jgi:hypothetical protein
LFWAIPVAGAPKEEFCEARQKYVLSLTTTAIACDSLSDFPDALAKAELYRQVTY